MMIVFVFTISDCGFGMVANTSPLGFPYYALISYRIIYLLCCQGSEKSLKVDHTPSKALF